MYKDVRLFLNSISTFPITHSFSQQTVNEFINTVCKNYNSFIYFINVIDFAGLDTTLYKNATRLHVEAINSGNKIYAFYYRRVGKYDLKNNVTHDKSALPNVRNKNTGVVHRRTLKGRLKSDRICNSDSLNLDDSLYGLTSEEVTCKTCLKIIKKKHLTSKPTLSDKALKFKLNQKVRIIKRTSYLNVGDIVSIKSISGGMYGVTTKPQYVRPIFFVKEDDLDYIFEKGQKIKIVNGLNKGVTGVYYYYMDFTHYIIDSKSRTFGCLPGHLEPNEESIETPAINVPEYRFIKPFKPINLLNCSEVVPTNNEKTNFFNWCVDNRIDLENPLRMNKSFNKKIKDNYCFEKWLIKHGYIEKVENFKPLILQITSSEQYWDLWHRLNTNPLHFKSYILDRQRYDNDKCILDYKFSRELIKQLKEFESQVDSSKK